MGWDAYAFDGDDGSTVFSWNREKEEMQIVHPGLRAAFAVASETVKRRAMYVDALLQYGGLDVSWSGEAMAAATGESVYGDPWSPKQVRELHASADWSKASVGHGGRACQYAVSARLPTAMGPMEIVGTETCLHIESAKEFLRVCAEQGLGIRFSW